MHFPVVPLTIWAVFTGTTLATPVKVSQQQAAHLTLQQRLELAGTAVDRLALITNDQDFVFDFNASTKGITAGKGAWQVIAWSFLNTIYLVYGI